MSTGNVRLGQVEPRERAGAQTGRKYEYQYERTARAALELLSDAARCVCIYCDWHDDYVIEAGDPPTRYSFRQVKGRKSSQGPWSFRAFFGVAYRDSGKPTKKPPSVKEGIVPLMLSHYRNFAANCSGVGFVTNAGFDPELTSFLETTASAVSVADLPATTQLAFDHVARGYAAASPPLCNSPDELLSWLRGLSAVTDSGKLEDADAALLEIASIASDYSEIDLYLRQSRQIAREIIGKVRSKVAHISTVVPAADHHLRRDKGIVVSDLLGVLSLSAQAYEQLKAGAGGDTVKNVSRLQRFCARHGLSGQLEYICGFKAQWDIWRTIERHFLKSADYVLLHSKAEAVLRSDLSMERVVAEARDLAKQFQGLTATPLTAEHVLGLVFSLAAETEMLDGAQARKQK